MAYFLRAEARSNISVGLQQFPPQYQATAPPVPPTHPLIFIDTNIFLDFYRVRGSREKGLSILKILDAHHDRLITGDQVRMEFSKNRQRVILDGYQGMKREASLSVPSILAEAKHTRAIERSQQQASKWAEALKKRLGRILREPATFDPVYQCAHRLFENDSPLNLSRSKKVRFTIRALARKRFVLGYPPRKQGDTSIGDAVNWEWLVNCALHPKRDVIIVSRDGDYGVQHDGELVINDWLAEEFRARVSRKRRVILTDRLSEALKRASVAVPKVAEAAEEELIKEVERRPLASPSLGHDLLAFDPITRAQVREIFQNAFSALGETGASGVAVGSSSAKGTLVQHPSKDHRDKQ